MKDKIFLLSVDEYCKYANKIPFCSAWWWLRTTYKTSQWQRAFSVRGYNGNVGSSCAYGSRAVRPALDIRDLFFEKDKFEHLGVEWIKLSNRLAIAERPIFDSVFDTSEKDYEHSEIRKKLLAWYEERLTAISPCERR